MESGKGAHLVGVLAATVEWVGDGELWVEAPAQHQLQQRHLVPRQRLGRIGSCLQLLQVVPQLKLHILVGTWGRWAPRGFY